LALDAAAAMEARFSALLQPRFFSAVDAALHPLEVRMLCRPPTGMGVGAMDSYEHTEAKYMFIGVFISWEGVNGALECSPKGLHRGVWPRSERIFTGFSLLKKSVMRRWNGNDVRKLPTKFQLQQIGGDGANSDRGHILTLG
jgi:hypothetical protein